MNDLERKQSQLIYNLRFEKVTLEDENRILRRELKDVIEATPIEEWHEDDGDCLWWKFPVEEPPYCGTPFDENWPDYHTHFTRIAEPQEIK